MFSVDETITVNTFGLVNPQFDEHVRFLDSILFGDEETLENVGQVTDVELVMEVNGSLSECALNFRVQLESGLDD